MVQAHGMQTRNLGRNYELHVCVDQENKGSKIFITSLGSSRGRRFQFKQTFKFSWQYSKIQPTWLTNHSAHASWILSNANKGIEWSWIISLIFYFTWLIKDGATLFYTSVKENKNCTLLHRYLVHQIYGLPFNSPALVVDKDSVFMWVSRLVSSSNI